METRGRAYIGRTYAHKTDSGEFTPICCRRQPCLMLEIFAEKRLVGEIQTIRYLLYCQVGGLQKHLGLHRDIALYPFARSASGGTLGYRGKVLGRDA